MHFPSLVKIGFMVLLKKNFVTWHDYFFAILQSSLVKDLNPFIWINMNYLYPKMFWVKFWIELAHCFLKGIWNREKPRTNNGKAFGKLAKSNGSDDMWNFHNFSFSKPFYRMPHMWWKVRKKMGRPITMDSVTTFWRTLQKPSILGTSLFFYTQKV